MSLNPSTQYSNERNLRARQHLWEHQQPPFDLVGWVLDLAAVSAARDQFVLDVGCGNGAYLRELRNRELAAVGCDLSLGMLAAAAPHPLLINADVTALPARSDAFDVVLAPHMLYHVADRRAAIHELRRVLKPNGVGIAVTNGKHHMSTLREIVETTVRVATPGWEMRNPSVHAFSLENGEQQLQAAFGEVTCVRPDGVAPVRIKDASVAADYVASVADHYQPETVRPWHEVVEEVRNVIQRHIDAHGAFVVSGDVGAFICR